MATEVNTILLPNAAYTATGVGTGFPITEAGNTPRRGLIYLLRINAVTGTTPTLAATIQITRDGGTTWLNYGTFVNKNSVTTDTITAAGEYYAYVHPQNISNASAVYPQNIRVSYTIGGTTPSFTMAVYEVVSQPG